MVNGSGRARTWGCPFQRPESIDFRFASTFPYVSRHSLASGRDGPVRGGSCSREECIFHICLFCPRFSVCAGASLPQSLLRLNPSIPPGLPTSSSASQIPRPASFLAAICARCARRVSGSPWSQVPASCSPARLLVKGLSPLPFPCGERWPWLRTFSPWCASGGCFTGSSRK